MGKKRVARKVMSVAAATTAGAFVYIWVSGKLK